MKSLLINLPSSTERREFMRQSLASFSNIEVKVIDAIDGRSMSENEQKRVFDHAEFYKENYRMPRPSEIGCALSHQKAYGIITNANEAMLVFEDDVYTVEDIDPYIPDIELWLSSPEPRILLLGSACLYRKGHAESIQGNLAGRMFTPRNYSFGAYAYAINPAAAHLLTSKRPGSTADNFVPLCKKKGIELKAIIPPLMKPLDEQQSPSTIVTTSDADISYPLTVRIRFRIRDTWRKWLVASGIFKRLDSIEFRRV